MNTLNFYFKASAFNKTLPFSVSVALALVPKSIQVYSQCYHLCDIFLETVGTRLDVFRISKYMGNLSAALNQGLGCVRTSAIVSFPRAEPGVSLGQRQSHASPDSREFYPRGFEEVIGWTEQYSEPD